MPSGCSNSFMKMRVWVATPTVFSREAWAFYCQEKPTMNSKHEFIVATLLVWEQRSCAATLTNCQNRRDGAGSHIRP